MINATEIQSGNLIKIFTVFLCLILGSIGNQGYSQKFIHFNTYNVDSLLSLLPSQTDTERIITLNHLATSLSYISFEQSIKYADEAMSLSIDMGYDEGKASAYQNYGHIYQFSGNYAIALKNYLESLTINDKIGLIKNSAKLCYDISKTHYFARNYEKSIDYALLSLKKYHTTSVKEDNGSVRDTMNIICGLGLIYYYMGKCDQSVGYTLDYINIGKENNFDDIDIFLHMILAGERYYCSSEPQKAKKYLLEALQYPESLPGIKTLKYRAKTFLGYLYASEGMIDSALYYYERAFDFYDQKGILFWSLSASNNLGLLHFSLNNLETAEKYFLKSELIFKEILAKHSWFRHDSLSKTITWGLELYFPLPPVIMKDLTWQQGKFLYNMLFRVYQKLNNSNKALAYHVSFSKTVDTLNNLKNSRELIELQTKYETKRNEEQIQLLSQKNDFQELQLRQSKIYMFGLAGLVVFIALLAIILIRQNKLKEQQESLLLQQKLFRSQMNPHFIFNSLTSIQNYILDEESNKASKYLSRFSKLVRNILDSSIEDYVSMEEEISTIENYLELQKIRFQNKFDYFIEVDDSINPENINIPPMLAQPFVENSIEHGIKNKIIKGEILIRFKSRNDYVILEVEDNGVGREKAKEILYNINKDHKSLATAITYERIKALNKKLKKKIKLNILDLKDQANNPSGTKVIIEIPTIL